MTGNGLARCVFGWCSPSAHVKRAFSGAPLGPDTVEAWIRTANIKFTCGMRFIFSAKTGDKRLSLACLGLAHQRQTFVLAQGAEKKVSGV